MKRIGLIAVVLLSATACASNIKTTFPQAPGGTLENEPASTGTVVVMLTEPMENVTVTIDNVVVAENKRTKRVKVDQVPVGEREVTVVASDSRLSRPIEDTRKIIVKPNATATIALATPSRSAGSWVLSIVAFVIGMSLLLVP